MTVTKGYFIDLKSLDRFEFQFNPDNIQDSKESEIEQIKIPGASHPRVSWGSGGARTISFDLRIALLNESDGADYVKNQVEWLQSLEYPREDPGYEQSRPPYVQFVMGLLYDLPCIVRKMNVRYPELDNRTLLPEYADINMTMEEVALESVFLGNVRDGSQSNIRYLGRGFR